MTRTNDPLWEKLLHAGVVQGPEPASRRHASPWFVKALLGFCGWLAAVFLLGFLAVGFQFLVENRPAALICGGAMIAGAYALLRAGKNPFVEHLALAVSLAGQAWVVWALFHVAKHDDTVAWILVALLQAPLAVVMPHFVHQVFSSFTAAFALAMALGAMGAPYLFSAVILGLAAWLWLNEFRYHRQVSKIQALGYGLVLALIPLKGTALFGYETLGWRSPSDLSTLGVQPWMGEVLAGMVLLGVVWRLLRGRGQVLTTPAAMAALLATLALWAVSMEAQGITVGITIMLLGFAGGNRSLLGLGIVSLLFFISSYYYLLDTTLLIKARTLLILGLMLLGARWIMRRWPAVNGGARRA